jgi:CHAT domain-containing protein/Tfp pilus assembly protein PilF
MKRALPLVNSLLIVGLISLVPVWADDPPKKLTAEERKELEAKWQELNDAGIKAYRAGKYPDAIKSFEESLKVARRLYNTTEFPDGHSDLATSLNNLAAMYRGQGKLGAAEPLFKDALEMRKRLLKGQDHTDLAQSLNNLAFLYEGQGKLGAAEPLFKDALEMYKRLLKGQDHPHLAGSLNNLAALYQAQGKLGDAEPLYKDALEMYKRLLKGQDHLDLAHSLNNLAALYRGQGKLGDAEPLFKDALEMRKRLLKGKDHPDLAKSLNNLAGLYQTQGKLGDAEPLSRDALEMRKRLFKGQDHSDLAGSLHNLAVLYQTQGKLDAAEPLFKDALEMYRRLAVAFAQDKTEGETLTLLTKQPLTRDAYLSTARGHGTNPAEVHAQLWADKGYIARAYERRLLQARAVATHPKAARTLADLTDARRRRAELLLAPAIKDPATLAKRKQDIAAYEGLIEKNTRELKLLLPASVRADKLTAAVPSDLQKALPDDAAVVDFLRFVDFDKPGAADEIRTRRYLAFVVTKEKVAWVDLDTAEKIEPAVIAWRDALTSGKVIAPEVAAKVRELVWQKVRKELSAVIKTVYVCPDAALCQVPFAALPGDKPGTILLEDFAVAMIPHAPFLLDKLWPKDPRQDPPANALVVGGVKYEAEVTLPAPNPDAMTRRGDPLMKPDTKPSWSFLGNTVGEANGVAATAERRKLPVARFDGDNATVEALLKALPKAKYAHFATHGFFADPSFRSAFQLDDKDYEQMAWGERRGRAALSPLVMTGLVFAGANNEKTPGRGIVTGEQLIDLDLSGLELAVLSACETGLGDVAGGQGAFGLQRAFHYAGTTNVMCSLWKVPDESTAALMNLFYTNFWDKNLSPLESLRHAQLEIYKNPGKIGELAKGFRGKFEEVSRQGDLEIKPGKDGTAHPLLWAAFTLSGPGR